MCFLRILRPHLRVHYITEGMLRIKFKGQVSKYFFELPNHVVLKFFRTPNSLELLKIFQFLRDNPFFERIYLLIIIVKLLVNQLLWVFISHDKPIQRIAKIPQKIFCVFTFWMIWRFWQRSSIIVLTSHS